MASAFTWRCVQLPVLTSDRKWMPSVVKMMPFHQKFYWHCIKIDFYDQVRLVSISGRTGNRVKMAIQSDSSLKLHRNQVFLTISG